MPAIINRRVQKHREALRASGMRPVQLWVPDTRRAGFADECRRQAVLVAGADAADENLDPFLEAALADLVDEKSA